MKRFLMTIIAMLTMVLAANAMTDMGPRQRVPRRHTVAPRHRAPRHYRHASPRFRHHAPPPRYRRHYAPRYRRHAAPPRYRRHAVRPRTQARRRAPRWR